ncbi:hypothetical protein ACWGKF_07290 [Streptomyces chartreusis]
MVALSVAIGFCGMIAIAPAVQRYEVLPPNGDCAATFEIQRRAVQVFGPVDPEHPEKAIDQVPKDVRKEVEDNCKAGETTRWLPLYGIMFSLLTLALIAAWPWLRAWWQRRGNGAQGSAGPSTAQSST